MDNRVTFEPTSEAIYKGVKNKLLHSDNIDELLPFVKALLPPQDLQNILLNRLEDLNNKNTNELTNKQQNPTESNTETELRLVYYQISPITEILPCDIIVKIIKYVPNYQYGHLPLISKEFKQIMYNNPSIFNKV